MARDAQEDIRRINSLKERVKQAQMAAAGAKVHHEQAQEDLETARKYAEELGIDPDDTRAFERWIDEEVAAIEALIKKAETNLGRAQETLDGR